MWQESEHEYMDVKKLIRTHQSAYRRDMQRAVTEYFSSEQLL